MEDEEEESEREFMLLRCRISSRLNKKEQACRQKKKKLSHATHTLSPFTHTILSLSIHNTHTKGRNGEQEGRQLHGVLE